MELNRRGLPSCRAVLGQLLVAATTNEHKAALQLHDVLPLAGKVVAGDAAFCQKDVCNRSLLSHLIIFVLHVSQASTHFLKS
jgi:hypothetical protein